MTDVLDLLAHRNPVDEAALPARDSRATDDLARIADGPIPAGFAPRRRYSPPVRTALAILGVAGAAGLVGALFLALPGGGGREPRPAGPGTSAWGLDATVRIDATAKGTSLDAITRRAAEVLTARLRASGVEGGSAEAVAPGAVRLTVPWATLPAQIRGFTDARDLRLYDLSRTMVATSRTPARAFRLLQGAAGAPRRSGWYAFSYPGPLLVGGPFARREPTFRDVTWVRAARGLTLITASGMLETPVAGRSGIPFLVLRDRPFASGGRVASVATDDAALMVTLTTQHPGGTEQIATFAGATIGVVVSWQSGGTRLRVDLLPGQGAALWETSLAGGGVDASMSIEAVRPVGAPPARVGRRVEPIPAIVRRNLVGDVLDSGRDPVVPETILRVFSAKIAGERYSIWEGITRDGGSRFQELGPGGGGGSTNCALDWTAKIIRRCLWGPASVVGRVAPTVARVEVRGRGGDSEPVIVQNGWFLVASRAARGATIVALDKDGNVLREIPR